MGRQTVATNMPEETSLSNAGSPHRAVSIVLGAGALGVLLAVTIALWTHYGTAVFFETIRAGFVACFG